MGLVKNQITASAILTLSLSSVMCEGGARQLAIEEAQDNRAKRQEESRKKHKITKTLER